MESPCNYFRYTFLLNLNSLKASSSNITYCFIFFLFSNIPRYGSHHFLTSLSLLYLLDKYEEPISIQIQSYPSLLSLITNQSKHTTNNNSASVITIWGQESMAMLVEPPNGIKQQGKHYYSMWQTLFEIDTKYVPIKPIGRGAYGVVCSSINRETNEKVAIKKIHNVFENRVDALRTLRELKLLRHVRHDNVIALKDVMLPTNKSSFKDVYLVYELMDTDLHQIIKSSQSLSDDHCKYFLFQLLRGLKYLHSANILHRDLKPGNLLVNANCDLKICDFGLARTSQGNEQFMTEYVVTRWYRAPELLLCCDNYGTSIDVWSVGCIFAEILGRKPIFPGTECLNQLKLIINVVGSQQESDIRFIDNPKARRFIKSLPYSRGTHLSNLYPQANPLAIDLLQRMLVFDPTKRISVTDALSHPYMAGLFDPGSNPPAHVPISLDIDENMEERMIREMMWDEMLYYHPGAETANP
ncbi:BnaA09g09520D [Brassica napus]|uniref:Mitogen-activated protein kinase n=3 Tax=Brassica TaxID=3705 RepID=A0A078GUY6_BRANA|nr:unnamed protein product [Brassica napus]CDY30325.1 BnaA09g09520D [Brassica napus]